MCMYGTALSWRNYVSLSSSSPFVFLSPVLPDPLVSTLCSVSMVPDIGSTCKRLLKACWELCLPSAFTADKQRYIVLA